MHVGRQDRDRVVAKGHHRRGQATLAGGGPHLVDQVAMADVDAVEDANGQRGVPRHV